MQLTSQRLTMSDEARDLYSTAVTRAVRSFTDVSALPAQGTPSFEVLMELATGLRPAAVFADVIRWVPERVTHETIETLKADCERSLREDGLSRLGKRNAPLGSAAITMLDKEVRLIEQIHDTTGLTSLKAVSATYIVYDDPGSRLELHIDTVKYGDVNMLLRINESSLPRADASATVFFRPDGIHREPLEIGEAIVFDGTAVLHGRTPLRVGEAVSLLSVGLRYEET